MLLIFVEKVFLKPSVGPNKVIDGIFNAQAKWVGQVSGPITRSTFEISEINEFIDNFSQILTFGDMFFSCSDFFFSSKSPQMTRKLASISFEISANCSTG